MSLLFSPITIRNTTVRNRLWVAAMCQYSAVDGVPNDWHLVHLGTRAVGGAGMVISEATAVSPEGRISAGDTGIWNDQQAQAWEPITRFITSQGATAAIQIAHAGRKASVKRPWQGMGYSEDEGWQTVAPSAEAFDKLPVPHELSNAEVKQVIADFAAAARRSVAAGFEVIQIHGAHGYLIHEFLSPLSNKRTDEYGGSFENRIRFLVEISDAVRAAIGDSIPMVTRISATDWVEGGWDVEQSVELAKVLKERGTDMLDVSGGGLDPRQKLDPKPGYQVPFAAQIRAESGMPTGTVGLITEAKQAEEILHNGEADAVLMARLFLRDPYFPLRAAAELGDEIEWPKQYLRGKP